MIVLSSLLRENPRYRPAAARITAALDASGIRYRFLDDTRDIWIRDFMPVRRKDGRYVSFRYDPSYLKGYSHLETDFKRDIGRQFYDLMQASGRDNPQDIILCSDINLDGGNVVLSPSGNKAVVSDRLFTENAGWVRSGLIRLLEEQLDAHVIVIPSDPDDMTGHADGMVRFLDENTVVGNDVMFQNGPEQRIKAVLAREGIRVTDFPFDFSSGISAEGCYLNYLETELYILLPVFGKEKDREAEEAAKRLFRKTVIPVRVEEIARDGGCLNCVSWEI